MKKLVLGIAVFGVAAGLSSAFADDDLPEGLEEYRLAGESRKCVSTTFIKRTEVLDDQNIVFEMRGNKVYLNRLHSRCPQLGFEGSFMYTVSTSHLCRGDIITVLVNGGQGASCSLGSYELLEEVEESDGEGESDEE